MTGQVSFPASRRRSRFVVILLAAGIAITCWWLTSGGIQPDSPSPTVAATPTGAPASATSSGTADATATMAGVERLAVDADLGTQIRTGAGLVRVRVVRDGDVPVADAVVFSTPPGFEWADLDPITSKLALDTFGVEARLEVIGMQTRSDAHGIAMVPRPTYWREAVGRASGLFGSCLLEGPEPEGGFVLRLVADQQLTVRLRDAAGAPAPDVRIGINATYRGDDPTDEPSAVVFGAARTDAAGVAVLRHLQLRRQDDEQRPAQRMRVVVFEPGLTEVGEGIDVAAPPPQGIDLQLPATGTLRVEVRDRDGSPLAGEQIALTDDEAASGGIFFAEAVQGDARFPVVGLGHRFHARSQLRSTSLSAVGPGPQQAGTEAVIRLQLQEHGVTLRGRAVDVAGEVLGGNSIEASGEDLEQPHVPLAKNGRFVILLDSSAVGRPLDLVLRRQSTGRGSDWLFRGLEAHLEGPPLRAGTQQLGDVVFTRAPLLASGRVIGVDPLPRLTGQVHRLLLTDQWVPANDIGLDLHADGTFEVFGRLPTSPPLRHLLHLSADDCQRIEPIELHGGERDLVIRIARAAALEALVQVDASVLQHPEVLVFETRSEGEDDWSIAEPEVVDDHLRLRIGELTAAPCSVRVRLAGMPEALVEIGDLRPVSGEVLREPRLRAIDLRQVRAVRLQLVDADGTPRLVRGEWLPTRPDRADDYLLGLQNGVAWVGAVADLDVLLFGEGVRPARVTGPARDTDVPVEAQPVLRLRFDGVPPLPQGVTLLVAVEALQPGLATQFSAEAATSSVQWFRCAADGTAQARVTDPGAVRLSLSCSYQDRTAQVLQVETTIRTDDERSYVVPTADVDQALAALGLRR